MTGSIVVGISQASVNTNGDDKIDAGDSAGGVSLDQNGDLTMQFDTENSLTVVGVKELTIGSDVFFTLA